ncbi:right-handed parallel beta-helix repeat-containing protein [Paenibacillus flagellatus]|uniref:Right handed beta helix domain-containing protein n=1 Tax=Paenibacillus flagellatus TaxID=2211139 RepID=A0A2V5KDH1_9BACL|nr:right-handed parallel beta-helix repeat-containing protein [Paenibacillus flagellatus]PYI56234.1 hypothetical protein DLM86_04405 [Paenibacillus flagellatus]
MTNQPISRRKLLASLGAAGAAAVLYGTTYGAANGTVTQSVYGGGPGGTSASTKTIVIDPAAWGIYTDGTHAAETTAGLNNAIADARSNGFTEVIIPEGTYLIRSIEGGVKPPSHIRITLTDGTIMKVEPNDYYGIDASLFTLKEVSNVRLSGGTLIGDRIEHVYTPTPPNRSTHEYSSLVRISSADFVIVENMIMRDSTGDCITTESTRSIQYGVYNPCRHLIIRNCALESARRNNISIQSNYVVVVDSCFIANAGITKNGVDGTAPRTGIDVEGFREKGWTQYKGLYNASSGVYPAAPANKDFWQIDAPGTIDGVFYGKYDMLMFVDGAWRKYERAFDEGTEYVDFIRAENFKIVNCTFENNLAADVNLFDSHYTLLDGNRFDRGVAMGFGYHVIVSNNIFKQVSSQKTKRAISGSGTEVAKGQFVTGNFISGYDVGIFMGPYLTASGNMIHDCNTGVQCYNVRFASVTDNKIERCRKGVVLNTVPNQQVQINEDIVVESNLFYDVIDGIVTTDSDVIKGLLIRNNTFKRCQTFAKLGNGEIAFANNHYDSAGVVNAAPIFAVTSAKSPVKLKLIRNTFDMNYASQTQAVVLSGDIAAYVEGNLFYSATPYNIDIQTLAAASSVKLYNNNFTGANLLLNPAVVQQSNLIL